MIAHLLVILVITWCGWAIFRSGRTALVLFAAGMFLLGITLVNNPSGLTIYGIPGAAAVPMSTSGPHQHGFFHRLVSLAILIAMVGGYGAYMNHIGAAHAVVRLLAAPLSRLSRPYLALPVVYLVGQLLNIMIPSAAGLAVLLLVAVYPALIRSGISPSGAAAVIGTTGCLDLGPLSATTIVAASASGLPLLSYFLHHQVPVAVFTAAVIATLHYVVQEHFDTQPDRLTACRPASPLPDVHADSTAPDVYAVFPALPLLLLTFASDLFLPRHTISTSAALLLSTGAALLCECIRKRSVAEAVRTLLAWISGMWLMTRTVVVLMLAAKFFTLGLQATGFLSALLDSAPVPGRAPGLVPLIMITITGLTAVLSGSGNAAFISLSGVAEQLAPEFDLAALTMILPMQFAAGICRSLSPVSGVIVIVAGTAGVHPFEIVKRTFLPLTGGMIVMIFATYLIN